MNTPMRTCLFGSAAFVMLACGTAAQAQSFDQCGVLVQTSPLCMTFRADSGLTYLPSPRPPGFVSGDRVRLRGEYIPGCTNPCQQAQCVLGASAEACPPVSTCRADYDRSGSLSVQDIFTFLAAYFSGTVGTSPPGADFDQNGSLTVNDIFAFLAAYFTGCV